MRNIRVQRRSTSVREGSVSRGFQRRYVEFQTRSRGVLRRFRQFQRVSGLFHGVSGEFMEISWGSRGFQRVSGAFQECSKELQGVSGGPRTLQCCLEEFFGVLGRSIRLQRVPESSKYVPRFQRRSMGYQGFSRSNMGL